MADPAPLRIVCPSCRTSGTAPARLAGKTVKCSKCGTRFAAQAAPPAPAPAPAPTEFGSSALVSPLPEPVAPPLPAATVYAPSAPPGAGPMPTMLEGAPAAAELLPTAVEAAPAPGPREWQTGDIVLGLYEVAGLLGQGGMGRVYRVHHRGWGVDLAVKVPLKKALDAAGGVEAFEREAETWVNLPLHPHMVSCYYVRRLEGIPRVFAELVDGGTLADAIRARRFVSVEAILDMAIQFAWGLHDAHEQGLVHRDVKPANVMITSEGIAKVTDFGLAGARIAGGPVTATSGDTTAMAAGGGGGTPAYMSPEQWAGQPLSRRTDAWSWGLSVLEAFIGQRTWQVGPAAPRALEDALLLEATDGLPAIPPVVAALLRRCFTADPEGRPHTMAEAADTLIAVYEAETARAYPRSRPTPGRQTAATLNNRAVSLLDLGRGDADALWAQALAAEPQHLESSYNQAFHGWTQGRLGDTDLLARVEEAQRASGGSARGLHLLGSLLLALGEFKRAASTLTAAAQKAPPTPELQRDLALALGAQATASGDTAGWREAAAALVEVMRSTDEQPVDVAALTRAYIALGQGDEAQRIYAERSARHAELPRDSALAIARFVPGHERTAVFKDLTETAMALAVTPDGGRVIAATGTATLRSWNAAGGAHAEGGLTVPDLRIRCLAMAPDGRAVLVGGEGTPPQLCDLSTGRALRAMQRHPGVTTALAISRDGRLAAGGSSDRTVRVWEVASGRCLHVFEGHTEAVTCVALTDDGARAVSGSLDGTVRLWDTATGQALATMSGHRGRVAAVGMSADGGVIVSGGEDRTVRHWAGATGQAVRVLAGPSLAVSALAVSRDGQWCAAASQDRTVRVWHLARGRFRALVRVEAPILAAAGVRDSPLLWLSCGKSIHGVRLDAAWRRPPFAVARPVSVSDVQHRDAAFRQRLEAARQSLTRGDLATAVKLAREARFIPGHERSPDALALWDDVTSLLPRKGLESAWELAALAGHRDPVVAVGVGADGTRALSGDLTGQVRVWDLVTRTSLAAHDAHEATVSSVALTPDGKWGVSASWDRTLRLWPLADAASRPRVLQGHADYVNGVAVSPDGRSLLSASSDQTLRLWEVPGGRVLHVLEGHDSQVSACAFGADGRYAVSSGWDGTVRLWDLETHSCVAVLEGHDGSVGTVAVSPDGRQAASGGVDTTVRVWDLRSRHALRTLSGHSAEVTSVCFFLDGRHLASSSRDKTVRLWDIESGRCLQTLPHTGAVLSLAAMPAGNALLTGGTDLVLRLWRLDWEPEARALPAWDEKARTHLATLATVRAAPGTRTIRGMNVDTLVQDLRHRGFGGLQKETVAARLDELAANPEAVTSAWDEIRAAAPAASRRVAAAHAARRMRSRLPAKEVVLAVAGIVFALVLGVALFRPRKAGLGLSHHQVERVRQDLTLVKLFEGAGCTDEGGYEHYLELARAPVVAEETLACLTKIQQPGLVDAYFASMQLDDVDPVVSTRKRKLAIAFLAGLGEPATNELCHALETGSEQAKWVAARALPAQGNAAAVACVSDDTQHADPLVRAAAADALRLMIGAEKIPPARAWELLQPLAGDADPRVRLEAINVVAMFDFPHALPALAVMEKDGEPAVAAAAHGMTQTLRNYRFMNPDRPY